MALMPAVAQALILRCPSVSTEADAKTQLAFMARHSELENDSENDVGSRLSRFDGCALGLGSTLSTHPAMAGMLPRFKPLVRSLFCSGAALSWHVWRLCVLLTWSLSLRKLLHTVL